MTCPICGEKTRVINTLTEEDAVYRLRRCISCKHRFGTEEAENDEAYDRIAYGKWRVNKV